MTTTNILCGISTLQYEESYKIRMFIKNKHKKLDLINLYTSMSNLLQSKEPLHTKQRSKVMLL